ncbi:MAG TPA: hypothetical protein VGG03_15380, partial [Thermoanaerobaculia bacterium]
ASRLVVDKCRGRLPGQSEDLALAVAGVPKPTSAGAAKPQPRPREERPAAAVAPFLRRAASA